MTEREQENREHEAHAMRCRMCDENDRQREFMSKRYLATDDARKALKEGIESALVLGVPADVRRALQLALTAHGDALLSRI